MKQEIDCLKQESGRVPRIESVPVSRLPEQTKLFTHYQENPLSLKRFYPSVVESHTHVATRIPEVLSNYKTDRVLLCDALVEINTRHNAGEKTFTNIELLREGDTVAVVTGQQAGLFSGPLYSIYKALSAVKMSECLRGRGFNAVPIFWAATEDHDFDEVSNAFVLGSNQELMEIKVSTDPTQIGKPVGNIKLGDSISGAITELFEALPETDFTAELRRFVEAAWHRENTIGDAFGTFLANLIRCYGLIIVDPLDDRLKILAAPIYADAVERSDEIVAALVERSDELEEVGYHAQVLVTGDYFPLFLHMDDGRRKALKRTSNGLYRIKGEKKEFTVGELSAAAASEPQRFSPGVMLRPVVQDYLLPTVCYFGGGAEIAYFAQNSEVYRILERPVTPILHRQSFTVVEAKYARVLDKFDLKFVDLFVGLEKILPRVIEEFVDPQNAKLFFEAEEKINTELDRLDHALSRIDPTLSSNLATRRRKILYHIGALRKKFHSVEIEKNEIVNRQIRSSFSALLPKGHLQERTLNATSFLNRYGPYFIDWVYDSIDLDDKGHRVIYL